MSAGLTPGGGITNPGASSVLTAASTSDIEMEVAKCR